jgi:hypothetical protein
MTLSGREVAEASRVIGIADVSEEKMQRSGQTASSFRNTASFVAHRSVTFSTT